MTGGVTQTVEGLSSNPRPTIKKKGQDKEMGENEREDRRP
jgi:hypothetical protein